MVIVRRSDKFIVSRVEQVTDAADFARHPVDERLGRHSGSLGLFLNLLPMLVCARQEENLIALHSPETSDSVGQHYFIGIAYVRLAGRIGDGGGDVVFFLFI